MQESPQGWSAIAVELFVAALAAFAAGLIRRHPTEMRPTFLSVAMRVIEAIVCGMLAVGVSQWLQFEDLRVKIAVSAAFGMLGAQTLSLMIDRLLDKAAATVDKKN